MKDMNRKTDKLPPFFTHPIGSLPRPKVLLDILSSESSMAPADFRQRMNEMVIFAIRLQEQAGLDVVSDGEWRRVHYIKEFLNRIGGFAKERRYHLHGEERLTDVVVERIESADPVFTDDATFLAGHTDRVTKFALPSPFLIATRFWHEDYSATAYPTRRHFMDHLAEILHREARALAASGIGIIQLDDPALTYFCDKQVMKGETHDERLLQEWNVDEQFPAAVEAINHVAEGLDARVHLHCCHSVFKRRSDVSGNYKPILPRLEDAKVDCVNLEFAYTGTGDASDLELLPGHLSVGMGVIDVRTEAVQEVEQIETLGSRGVEFLPPGRIGLNPDCGFAPDAGEPPTIDEAFVKLRNLCEAARRLRARFPE